MNLSFGWNARPDTSGSRLYHSCVFASEEHDMGATVYYCQVKQKLCDSTLCQKCRAYKSMHQLIKEARLKEEAGDDIDDRLER
jgi:hypothetical protein